MSAFTLLNTPFLICLGILLAVIGLLAFLFNQRLSEQNHKISSMFELVSTMAQELNAVRGLNRQVSPSSPFVSQQPVYEGGNPFSLIPVSDNDDDEENDDDDDSEENDDDSEGNDDDSEENDDDEDDDGDDEDDDNDSEGQGDEDGIEGTTLNIKSINLNELADNSIFNLGENLEETNIYNNDGDDNDNDNDDDDDDDDDEDDLEELIDDNDEDDDDDSEGRDDSNSNTTGNITIRPHNETSNDNDGNLDELNEYENLDFEKIAAEDILSSLKTIHITDLEETQPTTENDGFIDFKKLSLPKLRSIVSEKGLSKDANKLKKNDLIKLLEA
jgi:hypothetical protein